MVVLDSRPFDEYRRVSIPTATNVPGAELVLRVRDMAPSPDTLVVVNCAGRTRSIIGAQSLINAGVPNKVVALRNGTMGCSLAGFACDSGKDKRAPTASERKSRLGQASRGRAWRSATASSASTRGRSSAGATDETRTLYLFDVRDPPEYDAGHVAGAISAPGGQLVQATDQYAGTLGARIVLVDDAEVRAVMTASWLRQMGWKDVFVLAERAALKPACRRARSSGMRRRASALSTARRLPTLLTADAATVVDLSLSPNYRKGHIPGAWFAIRSRLAQALPKIPLRGELVLTSEDGVLAGLAVAEAPRLTRVPVRCLAGGNAAWQAAGLSALDRTANGRRPVDVWLKPYERAGDTTGAMSEYLSWEVDLVARIERDGTCNFTTRPLD